MTTLRRLCVLSTLAAGFVAAAALVSACGEEDVPRGTGQAEAPAPEPAPAPVAEAAPGAEGAEVAEPGAPTKARDLPESAFIETDENRDPFRSYIQVFNVAVLPVEETEPRTPVLLEDYELDALRLIAIVSGQGGQPRAMVVDPDGKGWVIQRGDYVGHGERVRIGPGQPEREINWRVVRIRPDRVILVRDDPAQTGPQVTFVMRLYPEEET